MTAPHGPSEDGLRALLSEVDCRIEHGAESGGHLEYVRDRLRALLPPVSAPGPTLPEGGRQDVDLSGDLRAAALASFASRAERGPDAGGEG